MYTLNNFRDVEPVTYKDIQAALPQVTKDVLEAPEDVRVRMTNLQKALVLSNGKQFSVHVIIKLNDVFYRMLTPVYQFDGKNILIGSNEQLPIACVFSFDFSKN